MMNRRLPQSSIPFRNVLHGIFFRSSRNPAQPALPARRVAAPMFLAALCLLALPATAHAADCGFASMGSYDGDFYVVDQDVVVSASCTNSGSIAFVGALTIESGVTVTNAGRFNVVLTTTINGTLINQSSGDLRIYNGTLTNNGSLINSGYFMNGGAFINASSGIFTNNGTFDNSGTFTNNGTVTATLTVVAPFEATGVVQSVVTPSACR